MAYLVFILGILQVLYPGFACLVLIMGLLALCFKRRDATASIGRLFTCITRDDVPAVKTETIVWLIFILVFMFLNLCTALTPPISQDALIYHLVGPKRFIQHHGIGFISGNFYTNFPFVTEMLFTMGMLLQGATSAKLIHLSSGLVTVVAIFHWTAVRTSVSTGLLAAAVYFTLPLVAKLSGWAYVDLSLAFCVFVMTAALLDWKDSQNKGFVDVAGIFGGLAMGIKYAGIVAVLTIVLAAVIFFRRKPFSRDSQIGITAIKVLIVSLVVASPWYVKNWLLTGNPVYPFLYSLFGGREWSHEMANSYAMFLSHIGSESGILDYLRLPWDVCLLGGNGNPDFDGYIGPVFLLVPILSIAIRPRLNELRFMLFFSAFYFMVWGAVIQQLRFLLPIFPVLCVALGLLIHTSTEAWRKTRVFIWLFCLLTMGINTFIHVDRFNRLAPHKYIAGLQSRHDFLKTHLSSYPAVAYINAYLSDADKVLFVFLLDGPYYCERPYVYDPVFEADTFMDAIEAGASAASAVERLRKKGITHILLNHDFVSSIAFILEPTHREKFAGLMGMLSPQAQFGSYKLYEVDGRL